MKYLIFLAFLFVGCEDSHECKICEKVFIDLTTNEMIKANSFEACDEELEYVEGMIIRATDNEGKTVVGFVNCK